MSGENKQKIEKGKALKSFNLWLEKDSYPKKYQTKEAGKPKAWYVIVFGVIANFFSDIKAAIKAIMVEIKNV